MSIKLQNRLDRLEQTRGFARDFLMVNLTLVASDDPKGGEVHFVIVPEFGQFTRTDSETEGAFLRRVFCEVRPDKPVAAMNDRELELWLAGESEEAALHYAEHETLPAEMLKEFATNESGKQTQDQAT